MKQTTRNSALRAAAKRGMVVVVLLAILSPAAACPMCKDSTVQPDKNTPVAADTAGLDFNRSIFVMLGGFLGLVGLTGRVMYKAAKST